MEGARHIFADQSHIDQVRDALWRNYGNGASIMVGSGFSRCALRAKPDADRPPMLPDLAIEIHKRLYPESGEISEGAKAPWTTAADRILSLTEEYATAFGRANLHQLLQELIRDDDLQPGEMHSRLLQLPWRDVFTTNWDTLLERARRQVVARPFSVVRDMDELPLANKPRIVKLHGSFPAQFPLILTEEDYRTYPTKFAPFVNTVQQAMMETVFCLIGFSGNDPNFLNWSGWVRDNLGDSAPRIYLAGWLDLPHHRRRMLEDRGVVPIDLARHPKAHEWPEHLRHYYAFEWVLHTLERGRPYDLAYWPSPRNQPHSPIPEHLQPIMSVTSKQPKEEPAGKPRIDEDKLYEEVGATLDTWKHNRHVYPGWLLLPASEERETLRWHTNNWEPHILDALSRLTAVERLNAIYELVWRREILLEPISNELESAAETALKLVDCQNSTINGVTEAGVDWSAIREVWRTVALALVTAARFRFDGDLFDGRTGLLEPFVNDHPDVYHRLLQERCLWAVNSVDFETLEHLLEDWAVRDCDPIWMIRKAALLWESDRNDGAAELTKRALDEIRSMPNAEGSVAAASREGWALWSAGTVENLQEFRKRWRELAALKCDAMLERDFIARGLMDSDGPQKAPTFDLSIMRDDGSTPSSVGSGPAAYRAVRLSEVAGLPPTTKHGGVSKLVVASGILKSAAEKDAQSQPELAMRLALRICDDDKDKTLMRIFDRTRVAMLSASTAEALAQTCTRAIQYALPHVLTGTRGTSIFWVGRLRVAMEVLSRLVLRLAPDMVEATLDRALACFRSLQVSQELWLRGSVGNLLQRSWEALANDRRSHRAIDLLGAPIVGMDNFLPANALRYPDPGDSCKPKISQPPVNLRTATNGTMSLASSFEDWVVTAKLASGQRVEFCQCQTGDC